ncbi:MAG: protein kinase [Elusimicrobia bacterium]|nr:protein kinase [Elusimicrobiota bacterium]
MRAEIKNPDPKGDLDDETAVINSFIEKGQKGDPKNSVAPIQPKDVKVDALNRYLGDEEGVMDGFKDAWKGQPGAEKKRAEMRAAFAQNLEDPDRLRQAINRVIAKDGGLDGIKQNPRYAQAVEAMTKLGNDMVELMSPANKDWSPTLMAADELSKVFMPPAQQQQHGQNAINSNPGSPAPYIDRAKDELAAGDAAGAVKDLSHALQLDPGNANALTMRAEGNYMQHDLAGAAKDAGAAMKIDPNSDKARQLYALSAGRGGIGEGGLSNAPGGDAGAGGGMMGAGGGASLALSGPGGAQSAAATRDAMGALRLGDYNSAIGHLSRAIEFNGNNAQAYNLRSIAYNRTHQYGLALKDAMDGLKVAPKNVALLLSKAVALNKLKRYKEAEAAARSALELDPNNAQAYNALAEALAGQQRNGEAIAALKSAAALDPRFNARLQAALQLPAASDLTFLFPEDGAAALADGAANPGDRSRRFKAVATASVLGGLLLAFGLLSVFMPKIKEALTHLTRRGPAVTEVAQGPATPASRAVAGNGQKAGLLRGQYEILKQIGLGGMGLVYEGRDTSLKRRVAIKKMRDELRLERRERERFVTEAKVVAGLHHPGIVDVYAILEENDDVFLVFEFVAGKTLHEVIQAGGPLGLGKAVSILKAAGEALDYAHSKNIIHRDLKPGNIMLRDDGVVKVMDFGIARVAKDAMAHYSMTNTVVGTPPYMAPEQEQGVVRRESDVYALGVCLYEMLSGKMPFNGTGSGMLLNKINKTYVPVSQMASGLPPAVDEVLAKALDPDPEKRFHSAKELVGALEALALPQRS